MKKMRMSKRGFTLTEIIVVVAIMVIVASAAFVGIAVILEKAENSRKDINDKHGVDEDGKELFEKDAWDEVDAWTKDAANFFDVTLYKPANPTNTPTPSPSPTPVPGDDNPGGGTNTPTPNSTNTPTPLPTNTPVPATSTPVPQGGGSNAAGSSIAVHPNAGSDPYWTSQLQFNKPISSCVVVVPSGSDVSLNQWQYSITKIDDNTYKVEYLGDGNGRSKQDKITIRLSKGGYIDSFT